MFTIREFVLSLIAALVLASSLAITAAPAGAIVGGTAVEVADIVNNWPFVAKLNVTRDSGSYVCTGVAVDPYNIVTAAHCVDDWSSNGAGGWFNDPFVEVEAVFIDDGAHMTSLVSIPSDWTGNDPIGKGNDIAVIHLRGQGVDNHIDYTPHILEDGDVIEMAGFGDDGSATPAFDLREATLEIDSDCGLTIALGEECMVPTGDNAGNMCGGDSGGPAFHTDDQGRRHWVGVNVVYTTPCTLSDTQGDRATVFTNFRLISNVRFLDSAIKFNQPSLSNRLGLPLGWFNLNGGIGSGDTSSDDGPSITAFDQSSISGTGEPGTDVTVQAQTSASVTFAVPESGEWDVEFIGGLTDQTSVTVHWDDPRGPLYDDRTFVADDTDGDGLSDDDEYMVHHTSPFDPDSDDDGVSDGEEIDMGTDPNDVDSDDDGLTDHFELTNGLNALSVDSDADGLTDAEELDDPFEPTDPRLFDSDGDGLSDGMEKDLGLDPTDPDPDGDGADDSQELEAGTDPFTPELDDPTIESLDVRTGAVEGRAFPGADVYVQVDDPAPGGALSASTTADEDGRFEVNGLALRPGSSLRVEVTLAEHPTAYATATHEIDAMTVEVIDNPDGIANRVNAHGFTPGCTVRFTFYDRTGSVIEHQWYPADSSGWSRWYPADELIAPGNAVMLAETCSDQSGYTENAARVVVPEPVAITVNAYRDEVSGTSPESVAIRVTNPDGTSVKTDRVGDFSVVLSDDIDIVRGAHASVTHRDEDGDRHVAVSTVSDIRLHVADKPVGTADRATISGLDAGLPARVRVFGPAGELDVNGGTSGLARGLGYVPDSGTVGGVIGGLAVPGNRVVAEIHDGNSWIAVAEIMLVDVASGAVHTNLDGHSYGNENL